ncbi:hypothetical protein NTE19_003356 [Vibrio fluvialis]|nr:hypothetical protein [Vibrio fluvialis]
MSTAMAVLSFAAKVVDIAVQLKRKSDEQELKQIRTQANADPVGYFRQFVRVRKSDNANANKVRSD